MENKAQHPSWSISSPLYYADLTLRPEWRSALLTFPLFLRAHRGEEVPWNRWNQDPASLLIAWGIPPLGPVTKQLPPDQATLDRLYHVVLSGLVPGSTPIPAPEIPQPDTQPITEPPAPDHQPPKPRKPPRHIPRPMYHSLRYHIDAQRDFGHQAKARDNAWAVSRAFYYHNHPVNQRKHFPAAYYLGATPEQIAQYARVPLRVAQRHTKTLRELGFIKLERQGYPHSFWSRNYYRIARTHAERMQLQKDWIAKHT